MRRICRTQRASGGPITLSLRCVCPQTSCVPVKAGMKRTHCQVLVWTQLIPSLAQRSETGWESPLAVGAVSCCLLHDEGSHTDRAWETASVPSEEWSEEGGVGEQDDYSLHQQDWWIFWACGWNCDWQTVCETALLSEVAWSYFLIFFI